MRWRAPCKPRCCHDSAGSTEQNDHPHSGWGPNRFFRPGRLARLGAADSLWPGAPGYIERGYRMKMSSVLRAALVAAIAFAGLSSARADEGLVTLTIYKAGWIIGGSGGSGGLQF